MDKYHIITKTLTVKPKDMEIFSDMATEVQIDDDGGGAFIVLRQHPSHRDVQEVKIDPCEWPWIIKAVEQQLEQIKEMNEGV